MAAGGKFGVLLANAFKTFSCPVVGRILSDLDVKPDVEFAKKKMNLEKKIILTGSKFHRNIWVIRLFSANVFL